MRVRKGCVISILRPSFGQEKTKFCIQQKIGGFDVVNKLVDSYLENSWKMSWAWPNVFVDCVHMVFKRGFSGVACSALGAH